MVEEPAEIKAPDKLDKPVTPRVEATVKVEEADNGPVTFRELEIVEEPLTIKPPRSVKRAASLSTPAFKVEKIRIP